MHQLQQIAHQNPQWSLDELVEVANQLLPQYLPDQGSDSRLQDTVNARLVRHYTTQGLLDRPLKQGREARYRYRHLLQLLLLRRLLTEGYNSGSLVQALQKSDRDLESLLQGGAQLTMETANPALAFLSKVRDRALNPPSNASAPRSFAPPPPRSAGVPLPPPRAPQPDLPKRQASGSPDSASNANPLDSEEGHANVIDDDILFEFADCEADLDLSFGPDFEAIPEDIDTELETHDLDRALREASAFGASAFSSPVDLPAQFSPELSEAESAAAPAAPTANLSHDLGALLAPAPLAPVTPDASLWSRHTILDGLELHIRADFIYPTTPQERDTLLQIIADQLRFLAAHPPSHKPPSHRRSPP